MEFQVCLCGICFISKMLKLCLYHKALVLVVNSSFQQISAKNYFGSYIVEGLPRNTLKLTEESVGIVWSLLF